MAKIIKSLARSESLKRYWATKTVPERSELAMRGNAKRIKTCSATKFCKNQSANTKKWWKSLPEPKRKQILNNLHTLSRKKHEFTTENRNKLAKLMSAMAERAKAQGRKWGAGGWNKGISPPQEVIAKRRSSMLASIKAKQFNPQKNMHGLHCKIKTRFGSMRCDSRWERDRLLFLASLDKVRTVKREPYRIEYYSTAKTGKLAKHIYIPDFEIYYLSGKRIIEEIKPTFRLKDQETLDKFKAVRCFCISSGLHFRVIDTFKKVWNVR